MKTKHILLLLLLTGITINFGCRKYELGNPAPSTVADFTYTLTNNGNAPCDIIITNKSLNAKGYLWDFGNGITSTQENPRITYTGFGLFTVSLTCTPFNDVHYNKLKKTMAVNVKDPNAGLTQVLYFTTRSPTGGGVRFVILNDNAPIIQEFDPVTLSRPYGIAVDTANRKVYISDYLLGVIYRYDADGKNPVKILDKNIPGQEIVGSPEAMFVLGDKLYWGRPGGIYRCNLDGTQPEVHINTLGGPPEFPIDMQYDPATGKIYLVNDKTDYSGGYFSVNLNGTGLTNHLPGIDGTAIEVNPATGKVYLVIYPYGPAPFDVNRVFMCNLDGSAIAPIGDCGPRATWGITIDHKRQKLFWSFKTSTSAPDGKIVQSNLDGSGATDWLTGISPHALQVTWIKL